MKNLIEIENISREFFKDYCGKIFHSISISVDLPSDWTNESQLIEGMIRWHGWMINECFWWVWRCYL